MTVLYRSDDHRTGPPAGRSDANWCVHRRTSRERRNVTSLRRPPERRLRSLVCRRVRVALSSNRLAVPVKRGVPGEPGYTGSTDIEWPERKVNALEHVD